MKKSLVRSGTRTINPLFIQRVACFLYRQSCIGFWQPSCCDCYMCRILEYLCCPGRLHCFFLSYWNVWIIITIRHQLDLDKPVSASYDCPFKSLPSRLLPFGLQFSIPFAILLLFILVTCRSRFDLYLRSFLSTDSAFSYSKISAFLLWSTRVYRAVLWKISSALMPVVLPFSTEGPNFVSM